MYSTALKCNEFYCFIFFTITCLIDLLSVLLQTVILNTCLRCCSLFLFNSLMVLDIAKDYQFSMRAIFKCKWIVCQCHH